jgi:hypothetical protein
VSATVVFRNLATPVLRTFGFAGVDATGQTWARQVTVNYLALPPGTNFNVTASPLIVTQNTAADPSCQWAVQLTIDELGGYRSTLTTLYAGGVSLSTQIPAVFSTPRLDAWGSTQGTLCFSGITPPATDTIQVAVNGVTEEVTVAFAGPPANPGKLTASPSRVDLAAASASQPAQASLAVNLSDPTQPWTAAILPTNRAAGWLSASKLSGIGPSQITLTASGAGFEPGVYRGTIVIQSPNAMPQSISVPVMFVSTNFWRLWVATWGLCSVAACRMTSTPATHPRTQSRSAIEPTTLVNGDASTSRPRTS